MSEIALIFLMLFATILLVLGLNKIASRQPNKEAEVISDDLPPKKEKKYSRWIIPLVIALIISLFTVAGGILFFAIAWLLLIDPTPYSKTINSPSDAEIKTAKRLYTWLWWSSIITVPVFVISVLNLPYQPSTNERVISALIPLFFHLVLLLGFSSKSAFVFRHTQQAIFLIALRAGMAALAVNLDVHLENGLGLFLFGNGSLWLFGTLWGRNQAHRGACWWAKRKGQIIASDKEISVEPEMAEFGAELKRSWDISPREHLKNGRELVGRQKGLAKIHALEAFRFGDKVIKRQVIDLLEQLGEVEMF